MARRALVTGAGGFIGRHIVQALLATGWQVAALDHAFDPELASAWRAYGERVTLFAGDAAQLPVLNAQALVHAAALTANPDELGLSPEDHLRGNLDPLLVALAWAAARGARALVVSSSAVYRQSAPGPLDETTPPTPLGLYAVAKTAAEALAETLRAEFGRDVAAVRLSSIYGPGELPRPTRPRLSPAARLIAEAISTGSVRVYRGDPARDWTYAPDIGRAVAALLNAPHLSYSLYNLASGQVRTPLQMAESIATALPDTRIEALDGADPALAGFARFGVLTNQRLHEDTGFDSWTPFDDGIAATAAWMCDQVEAVR
ncbi:MAG TPA: NAD(P)-dependent oxidoreductase [Candidatus Limnocylindrales bacterium]|nr:NAD(P)-dependent oxidoreductase [Candidatus Limnocylindrales bacterium]